MNIASFGQFDSKPVLGKKKESNKIITRSHEKKDIIYEIESLYLFRKKKKKWKYEQTEGKG